jgi:plastocyanin
MMPQRNTRAQHSVLSSVNKRLLLIAPLLAATALAAGCGSGGSGTQNASATKSGNGAYDYNYGKPQAESKTSAAKPAATEQAAEASHETVVKLTNTSFQPQSVDVKVGDTVTFVNADPIAHTATADDKSFDSGTLDQGAKFSFKAEKAGTISYVCEFHPGMTGTINVT